MIEVKGSRFSTLTAIIRDLGMTVGAEIGVDKGRYSRWLLSKIKKLKLYSIDPYLVYSDYVESHLRTKEQINRNYETAKKRLSHYDCELIVKTSMEAVKDFEDESLDFVFIDGNHTFEYVVNDIAEWSKKVRPGGLVAGHDYWNSSEEVEERSYVKKHGETDRVKLVQVKDAVDAWVKTNKIKPCYLLEDLTWFYIR